MKRFKFFAVLVLTLVLVLFLFGCGQRQEAEKALDENQKEETTEDKESDARTDTVTVYYADANAQYLYSFSYDVREGEDKLQFMLEKLFEEKPPHGFLKTVPEKMEKPEVKIEGDTAVVDLKSSSLDYYPKGSTGENLFIYSLVNSLVDTFGVKKVKFTVDGKPAAVEGSNYDFSTQEFEFNKEIVGQ